MNQPSFRDLEQISAYLDGQLSRVDSARLESRIQSDPELRSVYEGLSQSRAILRKLPQRRAPRNFRLTPQMAGIKPPLPRAFPVFRLASALAAVLFFLGYAFNLSAPLAASMRAAATSASEVSSAPAIEMAGAATQALETPSSKFAPPNDSDLTATPDESMTLQYSDTEIAPQPDARSDPYATMPIAAPQPPALPIHPAWLFGFLGLAVVSGVSAFIIRVRTEKNWAKANNSTAPVGLKARDLFLIVLAIAVVLALAVGLYWMSTDFSDGLGGDAGNPPSALAQKIYIMAGMGYNFSVLDSQGLKTIIDFPKDALNGAATLYFIPGLGTVNPPDNLPYFADHAFTLFPPPQTPQLQAPLIIRINYGDDVSSAVDENKLALYWWAGNQWLDAAATCTPASSYSRLPDSNQISLPVCQFGTFLLVAP